MPEMLLKRVRDEAGRNFLALGGVEEADNFTAALTPGVEEEALASAIRSLLRPGWQTHFVPQEMASVDPVTGGIFVGGRVVRDGRELELRRALGAGEPTPEGTLEEVAGEVAEALLASLEA